MTADQPAEPRLLRPIEVRRLFGVGRTTVHDWTAAGLLEAVTAPSGYRTYPAGQPAIQARLDAQQDPQCLAGCGCPMPRKDWAAQDGTCASCRAAQRRSVVQLQLLERIDPGGR